MITKDRLTAVMLTFLEWGLAGGLCGGLFAGLRPVMVVFGFQPLPALLAASAVAAMATAAFYSAMPVALIGTMAGVLASIGALILAGPELGLGIITGVAALAGFAAGSFFAWMATGAERPLARTLAGLLGGLIAGVALDVLALQTGYPTETFAVAAGVVALVGTLYEVSARWLLRRGQEVVPRSLAAAIVAALIASMVAAGIWLLGGTPTVAFDGSSHDLLGQVRRELAPGFFGGLVGGVCIGLVLELLGFRLEEHA
jgi:hypothetical protein